MWGEVQGLPGQRHTFWRARVVFVLLETRPDPVSSARGGFRSRIICFWQTQHATIVYQSYGITHLDVFFYGNTIYFFVCFLFSTEHWIPHSESPPPQIVRVMKCADQHEKPTRTVCQTEKSCCQGIRIIQVTFDKQ